MFDIGANNGVYTLLACASNPGLISHAFEPYPPVISILQQTIAANAFRDRVTLHQVALSDANGTAQLYVPDAGHGLLETSCSLNSEFQQFAGSVSVPTRRLDDMHLPAPSFIKLDVEGHEPAVLAGARRTLREARPILFIEVLREADTTLVNEIAATDGFQRYRLHQDGYVLREDVVAFDLAAWNHVLVPHAKTAMFESAVATADVPLR
ncbi:hypothetical protein ASF39_06945 [Methylobacterium sp. Leaf108]|nr:hypothetical protein ASF39_06945 [Methylobacterium sp. Leaf108]